MKKKIVSVWKNVLAVSNVSISDNFFDRGGDSMKAILFAAELKKNDIPFDPIDLFRNPALSQVLKILKEKKLIDEISIELDQYKNSS